MRILHVNEFYGVAGGLERYLQAICRELEARGHHSAVAYANPRSDDPHPAERPRYLIPTLSQAAALAGQESGQELRRVLEAEKPDIVMIHQLLNAADVATLVSWGPAVRFEHGFTLVCPSRRKMWNASGCMCPRPAGLACQVVAYRERCMPRNPMLGLRLIARTRRLAKLHRRAPVIVGSEFFRQVLLVNDFSAERVHVLPYFTEMPAMVAPLPRSPAVLFAGRLVPEKGVDRLLHALAGVSGAPRLLIAGDGPARPSLQSLAQRLRMAHQVEFLGWLPPAEVEAAMDRVGVVAIPSVWPEGFGIVGIEAMAHGRPVVAFDVGGIHEWLRHGETGLLVPPDDTRAFAEALASLLGDPDRGRRMGEAGRKRVQDRYRPAHHLVRLLALLEATIASFEGARMTRTSSPPPRPTVRDESSDA